MSKTFVLVFFLLTGIVGFGQSYSIKGTVADVDSGTALRGASISYHSSADSSNKKFVTTTQAGAFVIEGLANGKYILRISYTGYQMQERDVTINNALVDLGELLLVKREQTLNAVTVVGRQPPARQRGDTTEISASALKVNPDATTEDLLKKAPGITIENGQVTAQGEQVRRITIDGRQYFGDDATAALKNLPAEVIDKVQVFDRLSDQAQLTGFDDGNGYKAINIVTKANMRNGQFGRMYAGYGTDERYAAGGSVNFFSGDKRVNLIGLFNNVNQQNFSGEDLLGVNGQANQNRRGGGRSWGGRDNNFSVGQQPGIARTNAAGINYSDAWFKRKAEISGSYFYNNSNTAARSQTNRELFLPGDSSQFYRESRTANTYNNNHRVTFRAEYKIDSFKTLIIAPNLSFQDNRNVNLLEGINTTESGNIINGTINNRTTDGNALSLRNEITWRQAFASKRGRSYSINLNNNFNLRNSDAFLDAITSYNKTSTLLYDTLKQLTDNYTRNNSVSVNLTYSEPITRNSQIQINYNPQISKNKTDQRNYLFNSQSEAYNIPDTSQSNLFNNTVRAQNAGFSYRMGDRDKQLSAGVNYQTTSLESEQRFPQMNTIDKRFNNWLPNASIRYSFTRQTNLRIYYRTSVDVPSVNQLQNVYNITNPLFISSGNPLLDQAYSHNLSARISTSNTRKATSFYAGMYTQASNSYVTNGTWIASADSFLTDKIVLRKGAQYNRPVNLDGFKSLRSYVTYGFPAKFIKSNLNVNGGVSFVRQPGLINNQLNFSNNTIYNFGVNIGSNISEYIDFNLNYSGNVNTVKNTLQQNLDNRFYSHSTGFRINLLTKNGWFVLNDVNNQVFKGLADGFDQNFWLWNASMGKKFLKNNRGEIKASVFDLLRQNQSVVRNVGETYIEDVQTQVLQQYFMLTFTYTLRNFGKGPRQQDEGRRGRE